MVKHFVSDVFYVYYILIEGAEIQIFSRIYENRFYGKIFGNFKGQK